MRMPEEISNITFEVIYIGRSTFKFQFNQKYKVTYVYGAERGYASGSLDYLLMPDGYRICPYEQRKFWQYSTIDASLILRILYARTRYISSIIYDKNPFLEMTRRHKN